MDNPETKTTFENETLKEDIKKHQTQKTKEDEHGAHQKRVGLTQELAKGKQYLLLMRHPQCICED